MSRKIGLLRGAMLVAQKDLTIELRAREIVVSTSLFAVLVAVLTSLAFFLDDTASERLAPGVLWIAITFSGVLAVGRTWSRERDQDAVRALMLAPIPRASIWLGKALATLVFLLIVEIILVPVVGVLYRADLVAVLPQLMGLLLLGTIGFVAPGTLFGAMSVQTRARELVLSVVLFPLVAPALLGAVVGTRELMGGAPFDDIFGWYRVLFAYDLVVCTAGLVLFGPLTTE